MQRLYIISRADMSPGQQAVQGDHALTEFIFDHMAVAAAWRRESNTIARLEARDEKHLLALYEAAAWKRVPVSLFREPEPWVEAGYVPDKPDAVTAIVIAPSGRRVTRGLEPALRNKVVEQQACFCCRASDLVLPSP